MKRLFAVFLIFSITWSAAQVTIPQLTSGSAITWKGDLYIAGVRTNPANATEQVVYRLDSTLQIKDSVITSIPGNHRYLRSWSDTAHGYLSIYFQKEKDDRVALQRFDGHHRKIATISNIETGRLNNSDMLGKHPYYSGHRVYSVYSRQDSGGRQFYLNCYELKDPLQNFDYKLRWQYPFERKNVSNAFVIHAGKRSLSLFAVVDSGPKRGQWVLTVNAATGHLVKGTRLGKKDDKSFYSYGCSVSDTAKGVTHVLCEKKTTPRGPYQLYYAAIDSFGQIVGRGEFSLPWSEPRRGAANTPPEMTMRLEDATLADGKISAVADLYIRLPKQRCLNFCNSVQLQINVSGEAPAITKQALSSMRIIEDWLYLHDPSALNGRLCPDSLDAAYFTHSDLQFPVKKAFSTTGKQHRMLLQKVETGKGQLSFGHIGSDRGTLKVRPVKSVKKAFGPQLHVLNDLTYVLSYDLPAGGIMLQKGAW